MKVASWNVNSIKARKERLLNWVQKNAPDVLCLQELKTELDGFPRAELEALGYHSVALGQRSYNGVAILSRQPLDDVRVGLDDGVDDDEARLISAHTNGLRVISCYVPNGQALDSPKYQYKQRWLDRLGAYLSRHHQASEPLALCGDFNIAPEDRDTNDPAAWADSVLFSAEVRAQFQALLGWGLVDSFRIHNQEANKLSWWDYRMLSFPKGVGMRIDFVLVTRALAERCDAVGIDRNERKGKLPSDHAPVFAEFRWP
ncbi:MAG: exodeoxyribonuclease III [Myxococcales bacterium]